MFLYLIMGIEMVFIYAVYWFVFLHEPQPEPVKEKYLDYPHYVNGIAYRKSYSAHKANKSYLARWQNILSQSAMAAGDIGKQCSCLLIASPRRNKRQLARLPAQTNYINEGTVVDKFCLYLGRKLIQFSLRTL